MSTTNEEKSEPQKPGSSKKMSNNYLWNLLHYKSLPTEPLPSAPGLLSPPIDWEKIFAQVLINIQNNEKETKTFVDSLNWKWTQNYNITGNSLLHGAAFFRDLKLTKILLDMNYDVHFRNTLGHTPLQTCMQNRTEKTLEMCKLLIAYDAAVDVAINLQNSPFHLCTASSIKKTADWMPVFHWLREHSDERSKAMKIAKQNLTGQEFNQLKNYLKAKKIPKEYRLKDIVKSLEPGFSVSSKEKASGSKQIKVNKKPAARKDFKQTFVCKSCSEALNTQEELDNHQLTHMTDQPYLCDFCGETFEDDSALEAHLTSH